MNIKEKKIQGLYEVSFDAHLDHRGYMCRLYDQEIFRKAGFNTEWKQESRSQTKKKNTVRGLHVSLSPSLEGKMITATKGKVRWMTVDLRKGSETFGQWEATILSEETNITLIAPRGMAHGMISLVDDSDVLLRADNFYSDANGTGIVWNDKELNIDWGLDVGVEPIIRDRDAAYPTFAEFKQKYGPVEVDAKVGM